jgi:acetyltransferase-like isoleucine patch superfamily enzyme
MATGEFVPVFDTKERISGFRPPGSDEMSALIAPHLMGEELDGGERVTVDGVELELTERGNLIAVGVELPKHLTIGYGVYVGPGARFKEGEEETAIGSGSRVGSQELLKIGVGVDIGKGVVIGARSIRRTDEPPQRYAASGGTLEEKAEIEDSVSIGEKTEIGQGVRIGANNRIGLRATVEDGVFTESGVRIEFGAAVGNHSHLAGRSSVGQFANLGYGVYVDLRARVDDNAEVPAENYVGKDRLFAAAA